MASNYERWTRIAVIPILCGMSMVLGIVCLYTKNPHAQAIEQRLRKGKIIIPQAKYLSNLDAFHAKNFPEGNLAVRFHGLTEEEAGWFIFENFNRLNYNLYPRRVWVAKEGVGLRDSGEILAKNGQMSDDWLRNQGVKKILYFEVIEGAHKVRIEDFSIQGETK